MQAYEQAIKPRDETDKYFHTYLEGCSMAHLELAHCLGEGDRMRDDFEKAVENAREATTIADGRRPENAYNALGNALEDMAYYLGEHKNYGEAIDSFSEGFRQAFGQGWETPASCLLNRGRCRLRQISHCSMDSSLLAEAVSDLNRPGKCPRTICKRPCVNFWIGQVHFYQATETRLTDVSSVEQLALAEEACQLAVEGTRRLGAFDSPVAKWSGRKWHLKTVQDSRACAASMNSSTAFPPRRWMFQSVLPCSNDVWKYGSREPTMLHKQSSNLNRVSVCFLKMVLEEACPSRSSHCSGAKKSWMDRLSGTSTGRNA